MFRRIYRFHDLLTVQVESRKVFYVKYFDREFQGCKQLSEAEHIDLRVEIDLPQHRLAQQWDFDHRFHRLFRARYTIDCWDKSPTILKFASDASLHFYPLVMGAFLQTALIEPIIYWKGLHKGFLLVHSSCVDGDGVGTLISATGGGGKTTLALQLVNRGFGFLGDDLTFVTATGEAFAYPRPLHLFTYVTKHLGFLELSPKTILTIRFKDILRAIMWGLLHERFLISTRVDFRAVMPRRQIVSNTRLGSLLILRSSRTPLEQIDLESDILCEEFGEILIRNGEINAILKNQLLREPTQRAWVAAQESELVHELLHHIKRAFWLNVRAASVGEIIKILDERP